jgi:hypothetical protein
MKRRRNVAGDVHYRLRFNMGTREYGFVRQILSNGKRGVSGASVTQANHYVIQLCVIYRVGQANEREPFVKD